MLHVSFPGGVYQGPETVSSLSVAIEMLQERIAELQGSERGARRGIAGTANGRGDDSRTSSRAARRAKSNGADLSTGWPGVISTGGETLGGLVSAPRKAGKRWFVNQWPRIALSTGERTIPRTLDDLKAFLKGKGLEPHPRGDASMLLWQVRERLGLAVEPVTRPNE